jgi:hypothetical protein
MVRNQTADQREGRSEGGPLRMAPILKAPNLSVHGTKERWLMLMKVYCTAPPRTPHSGYSRDGMSGRSMMLT